MIQENGEKGSYFSFPPPIQMSDFCLLRPAAEIVRSHCFFFDEEKQKDFFIAVHGFNNPAIYNAMCKNFSIFAKARGNKLKSIPKTIGGLSCEA